MTAQTSHSTPTSAESNHQATNVAETMKTPEIKESAGVLAGLKAGDLVIVSKGEYGPDRKTREVREVQTVARVLKTVLQTEKLTGIEIATGRGWSGYGSVKVSPASLQDVAEVAAEAAARAAGDAAYRARQEAERADSRRREVLTREINDLLYRHVPESVLVRALAVLRGEEGGA